MCQEVMVYLFESMPGLYIPDRDTAGIERIVTQLLVLDHCPNANENRIPHAPSFQVSPFEMNGHIQDFSLKELNGSLSKKSFWEDCEAYRFGGGCIAFRFIGGNEGKWHKH